MKTNKFLAILLGVALMTGFAACSDDNGGKGTTEIPEGTDEVTIEDNDAVLSSSNAANWYAYAENVAKLLLEDATTLNNAWSVSYKNGESYATTFKNPSSQSTYKSYNECLEEIINGCADIANEVGSSKIGEPRNYWENKKYTQAVYAVESWYSWHSRDDYTNNIYSIRNAFNGTTSGTEATHSIASYLKAKNSSLYTTTKNAITTAASAIQTIPQPFRSHIGNDNVSDAMDACDALEKVLSNQLLPYFNSVDDDAELKQIITTYVDAVVLPTYASLKTQAENLLSKVSALRSNPSSANFTACASAWIAARAPWETSEAFLFGPVHDLGLDPNMDSWPLDADAIKNILSSGDFSKLQWTGEYDEDDEDIADTQNVRGFHTLEFLIFKDGKARTL